MKTDYDVVIIGGGLAGLVLSIYLAKHDIKTMVVERKEYPFHRVCGEYISNEVLPFLSSIHLDPTPLLPSRINELIVSSPSGKSLTASLDLGGFGISRFTLDSYIYKNALRSGVSFETGVVADEILKDDTGFVTHLANGKKFTSSFVVASTGKRSTLDKKLQRPFFLKRSPYLAVKYHIRTNFPKNKIALHNFKDGYCGISAIEEDKYCLCYLTTRENIKNSNGIKEFEESTLTKNPRLKEIFLNSEFLFKKPLVINEISFSKKECVQDGIFFSGDSAGMIAPLCGNGMAMAIHSSKILGDILLKYFKGDLKSKEIMEKEYEKTWNSLFKKRLMIGRLIQSSFGNEYLTEIIIKTLRMNPSIVNWLISQSHGKEF